MSSKGKKPSGSGKIHTFADLNRQRSGSGSDSDSDPPPEYYTGGEKSGMLVQDPNKGTNNNIDAIFEQARRMGATQGPIENQFPPSSSRVFVGTGRLLSGEAVPAALQVQQPENMIHNIVFWSDGFTVNDGPLRRFDDPGNASFLESIRKSECPKELEPSDRRSSIHVNLVRREGKCPEPAKQKQNTAFQGVGRTLGGGASSSAADSDPFPSLPTDTPLFSLPVSVDESLPSTSIQLRLADGTRIVSRFNTHHTVGDIRSFIDASRPRSSTNYRLLTVGFPPKQLDDASQTIEAASLTNSVVIQKI